MLDKSYWISPFSTTSELKRLKDEISHINRKIPVLIDMELPIRIKPYFRNLFLFCRHKRLLKSLIRIANTRKLKTYYCENTSSTRFTLSLLRFLGISENPKHHNGKILIMYYTSIKSKQKKPKIDAMLQKFSKQFGNRLILGLGTTAIGEKGNEPKLSYENLRRDLRFAKELGVQEVFLYRVGGLDRKYQDILNKESQ